MHQHFLNPFLISYKLLIAKFFITFSHRRARLSQIENENTTILAKRKDKIAKEYDGIWSINEDDIAELEKNIEIATQEDELYDDLIAKAKWA